MAKSPAKKKSARVYKGVSTDDSHASAIAAKESEEHSEPGTRQDDGGFIALALRRFKLCAEAESATRTESLDDLKFSIGEQWPNDIKTAREQEQRPCLTLNRLPQFIRQVTNEQRQQRPSIQINPVGSGADKDTAEILQGCVRHVEIISEAEISYDDGFDFLIRTGFGAWRVITDYCDDESFDQDIFIEPIENAFDVYLDPTAKKNKPETCMWGFVIEDLSHEEYRYQYPNSSMASLHDMTSVGATAPEWATKETVRIAEYFYVEQEEEEITKLDGKWIRTDAIPQQTEEEKAENGERKLRTRTRTKRQVKWAKINAVEVLEERNWPGRYVPIVKCFGDNLIVAGKRHIAGLVRHAKDPQRMYNYWNTMGTETIALAPKAPYVAAEGQIEGREEEWRMANQKNFAVLQYKPQDISGQPVPPPQRNAVEPPILAISAMIRQADADLKGTTGIYEPSLGQTKADQSGKAIQALQRQSDTGTLNFVDNLSRAIRYTGRIILDLIPHVYDTARIQRIVKPDGSVDHVGITNSSSESGMSPQEALAQPDFLARGIKRVYDVGVGKYDVTVTVGPSYQSKRQEATAAMMALVSSYPQVFAIIGDLLVRGMDWPGSEQIADRLKRMLPPELQDVDPADDKALISKLQAQVGILSKQHDALAKALTDANQIISQKTVETQSRERIERMKIEAQLTIAEIEAKVQDAAKRMEMTIATWKELHASAHERAMAATAPPETPPLDNAASAPQNPQQP